MCADAPFDKRTYQHRKVFPETGRVPRKKTNIDRNNLLNNKIKYRSKFELNLAKSLTAKNIEFQYEEERFKYVPAPRHYTPDFYFPETNIYVEAKGHLDKGDRVKMILMKQQHPELDIRFVFMNAKNKIYKGSKTTYAAWCTRYNFEWAEGSIPMEWVKK